MSSTRSTAPFDARTSVNDLIALHPESLPVLNGFGIDTCCGGALPLGDAAAEHGIDPERLLAALRAAVGER